jgi:hypothetical protein
MELKEVFQSIRNDFNELEKLVTGIAEKAQPKRFIDNNDNTVMDQKTGLTWIKDHTILGGKFAKTMTYEEAEKACKELNAGGHKDWRLPTREELLTIVDLTKHSPAIDPIFTNTKTDDWYWTSTPCAWDPSLAWVVVFDYGLVSSSYKHGSYYVRPVRSSQ